MTNTLAYLGTTTVKGFITQARNTAETYLTHIFPQKKKFFFSTTYLSTICQNSVKSYFVFGCFFEQKRFFNLKKISFAK